MDLADLVHARGIVRAPAVHFALIGAILFAAAGAIAPPAAGDRPEIVVPAERIDDLRRGWTSRHRQAPGPKEERAFREAAIDDEVLFHEALAIGLDRNPVVRRRLLELARFLRPDDDSGDADDEEALLAEAHALGLIGSDVVVRRQLVELMRLVGRSAVRRETVTEEEIRAAFEREADRYRVPERIRLTHVYVSRDRSGADLAARAQGILERLVAESVSPQEAPALGDPFLHGAHVPPRPVADLARMFGPGFPEGIAGVDSGRWVGPVPSSYGLHLVWIHERRPATRPPLDSVRGQITSRIVEKRAEARLRERLDEWRARYSIRISGATG